MGLKFVVGCKYKVIDPAKVMELSGIRFDNNTFTCHGVDEGGAYSKDGRFIFGFINENWDDYPRESLPDGWAVCGHDLLDSGQVVAVQ
ncbi:hypothetical protein [Aeromonas phage Akh-2]|nr:hypothetical protein [Aeromonas phage Akh-2]